MIRFDNIPKKYSIYCYIIGIYQELLCITILKVHIFHIHNIIHIKFRYIPTCGKNVSIKYL